MGLARAVSAKGMRNGPRRKLQRKKLRRKRQLAGCSSWGQLEVDPSYFAGSSGVALDASDPAPGRPIPSIPPVGPGAPEPPGPPPGSLGPGRLVLRIVCFLLGTSFKNCIVKSVPPARTTTPITQPPTQSGIPCGLGRSGLEEGVDISNSLRKV